VDSDTAAVRRGEELDAPSLARYLSGKLGHVFEQIEVDQFQHGHSNLVYSIRLADGEHRECREYVLRRPPLGPVPPKAHDMAREYRVLHSVHPHFPEAPEVFLLCEDPSVIGSAFFLMERRRGIVIRESAPPELDPRLVSEAFVECLVRLHSIDVSQPGLSSLGKPEGFVERQVKGWADRWYRARTEELPEMDRVVRWLQARVPPSLAAAVVHNDYKLDNVMLRRPEASVPETGVDGVEAVLDWEMATIGDPLADLGLTMCYWTWASVAAEGSSSPLAYSLTAQAGWYTRDEFLHRYASRTGYDIEHIGYHEILGIFKLAVILQQV
jgi:aminoglycoside phosphotransferase (APT) family kinase protein